MINRGQHDADRGGTSRYPMSEAWISDGARYARVILKEEREMAELIGKSFDSPDEVREFTEGKGRVELVDLNGHAIGRGTFEPGWRWSENVKPLAGTDSCQVEHIGCSPNPRAGSLLAT